MAAKRQGLIDELGVAVQTYQRSTDAFDDVVAARLDLNRTDLRCLDWLSGGAMSIGRLSQATALSSAATTKLVDRLERKGFVRRVPDETDRRRVLVELTPQAGRLTAELYGPLVAEGGQRLRRYDDATLATLRDHFVASTELTDRHRRRIAALPASSTTAARQDGRRLAGEEGFEPSIP